MTRIEKIVRCHPAGIVLREKDLPEEEYRTLAKQVMEICGAHGVTCILHTFVDVALELQAEAIHLPLPVLRSICGKISGAEEKVPDSLKNVTVLGASCHSVEGAAEAQKLGCTYITAGHVFATGCKRGLPPRGLDFLDQVCSSVSIPDYSIGGINAEYMPLVREAGAAGGCFLSGLMQDFPYIS